MSNEKTGAVQFAGKTSLGLPQECRRIQLCVGMTKTANPSARSTAESPRRETPALALAETQAAQSAPPPSEPVYGSAYLEWKRWNPENFGALSPRENADFAALLRKAQVAQ